MKNELDPIVPYPNTKVMSLKVAEEETAKLHPSTKTMNLKMAKTVRMNSSGMLETNKNLKLARRILHEEDAEFF